MVLFLRLTRGDRGAAGVGRAHWVPVLYRLVDPMAEFFDANLPFASRIYACFFADAV